MRIKNSIELLVGLCLVQLSFTLEAEESITNDIGADLDSVLEYERLIDENGFTACDHYFGWSGLEPVTTSEQKRLCGKYQFLYEHWSTVGIPKTLLQFNEKWYPEFFGDELKHFGYFPDKNPKRIVSDIVPVSAGECMETEKVCTVRFFGTCLSEENLCVRMAANDGWQEVFTQVEDDQLPVGFQLGPKRALGFESASFACAGCHMGTLNDGRYAIGMANKNLNYGQVYAGFNTPLQATMIGLTDLLNKPVIGDIINQAISGIDGLPEGFLDGLRLHPGMAFNDPSTSLSFSREEYPAMMRDVKQGTCYHKDNGDFIRCDHRHEERGPEHYKAQAKAMFEQLTQEYDGFSGVNKSDWPMAMKELMGDAYCMPAPFKPSDWGGDDSLSWGQFNIGLSLEQTAQNMMEACKGLRWNVYYWQEFVQYLMSMASADAGAVAFPSLTDQEMMINAGFNVLDFLIPPQSDDGVYTISRIPNVVGIPSHEELAAHGNMHTESGEVTPMLSLAGNVTSLEKFVRGFILLSGSVDPRYVRCETPDIVGNWDARPDETCEIIPESIEPLLGYILSLKPPKSLGNVEEVNTQGEQLFAQQCASCHAGPKHETTGVFLFSELEKEGLASMDTCHDGELTVGWTEEEVPQPIYNHCRPTYDTTESVKYLGFIGTDPTYSRLGNPDPATGKPSETPELESDTVASQGVKGQRLVGVRYKSELFHHGQLHSLEDVLCGLGTHRETVAQRAKKACLVYDLDSEEGLAAYKSGQPICKQEWRPYAGHEFGCNNTPSDKAALLEYLRSL
ncbi:hypothetical protein [Pleionea sp. CnH1-48]|uniref:hypothetical protein n=1 Tax=Pleionea sp. CnH1-48 TaxID=2954494 RepID=UPI0020980291|nr:hypothetical protein [Pleionea sp. CnH1-48]MCO7223661.1 hypothetical protein [Pleionea sp. CnH1-48]